MIKSEELTKSCGLIIVTVGKGSFIAYMIFCIGVCSATTPKNSCTHAKFDGAEALLKAKRTF